VQRLAARPAGRSTEPVLPAFAGRRLPLLVGPRSSVAYLIEALVNIARESEDQHADLSPREKAAHARGRGPAHLPGRASARLQAFHDRFRDLAGGETPEGYPRRDHPL
jgi:hypothetical protein